MCAEDNEEGGRETKERSCEVEQSFIEEADFQSAIELGFNDFGGHRWK
jgi:hypothetical protein